MSDSIDGVGIAAVGIGAVLIWAGVKGYSAIAVVGNLVTGKPLGTDVAMIQPLVNQAIGSAPVQTLGSAPTTGNQAIAQPLAASYGWTGTEWDALVKLWNQESSWNNHADNPSSHAYGIPQALPYTKMPKAAWPESAGGTSDATTQITWGLAYIRNRYGSPSIAWAHEIQNNWY